MGSARPFRFNSHVVGAVIALAAVIAVLAGLLVLLGGLSAEAAPPAPKTDLALFDPDAGEWHLRYGDGTVETFFFGIPGDLPLMGDWDCDGIATVGMFRPSSGFVYLRNSNTSGVGELSFYYGIPGDVPLAGDWDGDGCDTLAIQRNGKFYLADDLGTVPANSQFYFGFPGDKPFSGDFNGDGVDTIGLHRSSTGYVFLSDMNPDGQVADTDLQFFYGLGSDLILSGDWDADGDDSVGLYRWDDNRFHLAFDNGQGTSDQLVDLGTGDWTPLGGGFGHSSSYDSAVLVGAGDIAVCGRESDGLTAALLDQIPGTIFTTGDNVYTDGTPTEFAQCYEPTWGRHIDRTRPTPGNHDYVTTGAGGYYDYFGSRAGDPSEGWYSYDIGGWHVVALNSNCGDVGGCGPGSPQHSWLVADLAANGAACTLAYWHHPRWDAGFHPPSPSVGPFWDALSDADAEVVLNGHAHNYQRFGRQDPSGSADPGGIRQFTVGTGGVGLRDQESTPANLEVFSETHGVLKLELDPAGYAWEFVPVAGSSFTDTGAESCS